MIKFLPLFKQKDLYLCTNKDIQKLIVAFIGMIPNEINKFIKGDYFRCDDQKKCTIYMQCDECKNKLGNLNFDQTNQTNEKNEINRKIKIYRELLYDNFFLFESLWLKYIASKLPIYKDFNHLKSKYEKASVYYRLLIEIDEKEGKKYDIIYKNQIGVKKIIKEMYDGKLDTKLFDSLVYPEKSFGFQQGIFITAAYCKNIQIIKYLIDKKLNINAYLKDGESVLMILTKNNQYDIVKLLINNGVNINQQDGYGKNAIDIAIMYNKCGSHDEIIKLLTNHNSS